MKSIFDIQAHFESVDKKKIEREREREIVGIIVAVDKTCFRAHFTSWILLVYFYCNWFQLLVYFFSLPLCLSFSPLSVQIVRSLRFTTRFVLHFSTRKEQHNDNNRTPSYLAFIMVPALMHNNNNWTEFVGLMQVRPNSDKTMKMHLDCSWRWFFFWLLRNAWQKMREENRFKFTFSFDFAGLLLIELPLRFMNSHHCHRIVSLSQHFCLAFWVLMISV